MAEHMEDRLMLQANAIRPGMKICWRMNWQDVDIGTAINRFAAELQAITRTRQKTLTLLTRITVPSVEEEDVARNEASVVA